MRICLHRFLPLTGGFPHSDISGSKAIWRLAESYRSHNTSFIASWNLGIHHTPLHSCKEQYVCTCSLTKCVLYTAVHFECWSDNTKSDQTLCVVRRGRKDPAYANCLYTTNRFTYHLVCKQTKCTSCVSSTRGFFGAGLI